MLHQILTEVQTLEVYLKKKEQGKIAVICIFCLFALSQQKTPSLVLHMFKELLSY